MTTNLLGDITLSNPKVEDTLQELKEDIFSNLNCIQIGTIEDFDKIKKTAKIQLVFKRVFPNQIQSYPLLLDCPVFTLQGGTSSLQMPIQKGDTCLVLFCDRNINIWFNNGTESAPEDLRAHSLSDGIALVGLNSLTSTLSDYDENVNLTVPSGKKFVVKQGDSAEILGTSALALKSELDNIKSWLQSFINAYNSHMNGSYPLASPFTQTLPTITGTTKLKGS